MVSWVLMRLYSKSQMGLACFFWVFWGVFFARREDGRQQVRDKKWVEAKLVRGRVCCRPHQGEVPPSHTSRPLLGTFCKALPSLCLFPHRYKDIIKMKALEWLR